MDNIDVTRPVRDFKVRTLHKHFLTRFGGRDKKQTTYNVIHTTHKKITCIVVCLGETRVDKVVAYRYPTHPLMPLSIPP